MNKGALPDQSIHEKDCLELCPIDSGNIGSYALLGEKYGWDLKQYQSRIRPRCPQNIGTQQLRWYYIVWKGQMVGSIWLEKQKDGDDSAVFGIFIGPEECRGKGIGYSAIRTLIHQAAGPMGVHKILCNVRASNPRAIRCYKNCGFVLQGYFTTPEGIKALTMEYDCNIVRENDIVIGRE